MINEWLNMKGVPSFLKDFEKVIHVCQKWFLTKIYFHCFSHSRKTSGVVKWVDMYLGLQQPLSWLHIIGICNPMRGHVESSLVLFEVVRSWKLYSCPLLGEWIRSIMLNAHYGQLCNSHIQWIYVHKYGYIL